MMPWEPIRHQEYGRDQDSFLVETRTIQGYSGSPVFVYIPPFSMRPNNELLDMQWKRPWLLGVDWCHIPTRQPVLDKKTGKEISQFVAEAATGMMGVIPAWKLDELLDEDDVMGDRERAERDI